MDLPGAVVETCQTFLAAVPEDLVGGLYLCGGLALGEWVPGRSDVDFVATLTRRPSARDVEDLRAAHERVRRAHPATSFDGAHVLVADLRADPADCPAGPVTLQGRFDPRGRLDPVVAWHELAAAGLTVSGPPVGGIGVWADHEALRRHTRHNLDTYWRGLAERLAAAPQEVDDEACCWAVLGAPRLHHLLRTGAMTTKSGAGRWALGCYPERFHRVLREALRIREGGRDEYSGEAAVRARHTAELTAYVVAAGTS